METYIVSILDLLNKFNTYPDYLNHNGTFETDTSAWYTQWGAITRSTAQFHSGAASLLYTPDGTHSNVQGPRTVTGDIGKIVEDTWYTYTGWIRSPSTLTVEPRLYWYNKSFSLLLQENAPSIVLVANTWTQFEFRVKSPLTARQVEVTLSILAPVTPAVGDLLYADDVFFYEYIDTTVDPTTQATMVRIAGKPGNYYIEQIVRTPKLKTGLVEIQYYPAPGLLTWHKYPGAKVIQVELQGAGGAGGGCAITGAGQSAEGGGGGGGGYLSEIFFAEDLPDKLELDIGAKGIGVTGADGPSGGSTSIVTYFGVDGGSGGKTMAATAGPLWAAGGQGGSAYDDGEGQPDYTQSGGVGRPGWVPNATIAASRIALGGAAGSGSQNNDTFPSYTTATGTGADGYKGSGGGGARNAASVATAKAGGDGGDGWIRFITYF
jgi:hypothetical protein